MSIMNEMSASRLALRRTVLLALAAGLSVAAIVAIAAVLTQSFDRTDLRLVGTSLGFSVFSALGAAGARAERTRGTQSALGRSTAAAAALGFALLGVGMWISHSAGVWRAFGTVAVTTLAASHACLVLSAARATDSSVISRLATVSVFTASIDSVLGVLAITSAIKHVDPGYVRLLAVLVIVMLLTTALPPILRRVESKSDDRAGFSFGLPSAPGHGTRVVELLAIADQLDALADHSGEAAAQIENQAERLRQIARRYQTESPLNT
jgi:hypothetical protein